MGAIFTFLMTYGGSVVSLFRPFYGFLIYVCFAIVKPPALWHWSVQPGNHSRIIAIGFILGWIVNGLGDRKVGSAKPIMICLLGYWAWVIASTLASPNPSLGMPFIEYMAKIVIPVIAGLTLITSFKDLMMLFWTIVLSCGFLAYEANMAYLGGFDFSNGRFLSLDNNSFSILIVTGYGAALVFGFVDTIAWRRLFCLGLAAAMAHVPMLSMSRGGMVGVMIATAVAIVVIPKNGRTFSILLAVAVLGSILAGPSVIREFSTTFADDATRDSSAQSRIDLWADCVDAMMSQPVFGVGQEHWGLVAVRYGWSEGKEAHSLWFQTAAELGVPGFCFLLFFYAITIFKCLRLCRDRGIAVQYRNLAMAMIAALVGFAVSASFVTVEGFELPFYVVLLAAATIKHVSSIPVLGASHANPVPPMNTQLTR